MNPLEKRIEQLEKRVEQLEAQLAAGKAYSDPDVSRSRSRHHARHPFDPERAIRRARQQNSLWLVQGLRVVGLTVLLCFLCWGGVVMFEYAEDYFKHQSPTVLLHPQNTQP